MPLRERSVLVGRPSASRNIHPAVDCGTDSGVSRRHCQLNTDGQRWWVEDLQSANGTYVSRAGDPLPTTPIPPGHTLLKDGDRIAGAFEYDRERGRFHLFRAKAVVLATGGIGRAYKITSNSWEYTGDGHSLAYHAGAALMDMEFVQFHPAGMIWPPSVRGILVTEGVRGEGGVLRNRNGERFMFKDIPPLYTNQTADTRRRLAVHAGGQERETPARTADPRPLARCIRQEVREGRGSPHGGVFLDIAWIKERIPSAAEHIKKKLPSMYHQFKQLADIDITQEPMEVGPTTHYMMGGVKVDADSQMSDVPGLFAAGECAAGLHGANRLGGNSLSDFISLRQAGR